jgi:RNA polymerase sigma-70 factor, ECF subfamily
MTLSHDPTAETLLEQGLVTQAQGGDCRAFGDLVRLHRVGVVNVVYRMCGDAALAEDAAQECFVRAWSHLYQFRSTPDAEHAFRNWLYRIATNCALNLLRQEQRGPLLGVQGAELPLADPQPGPEGRVEESERARVVQRAVLALPEASRVVLILREYEALSYQEIAQVLGIPIGTVMSRLNYARCRLRERLASYLEEPDDLQ